MMGTEVIDTPDMQLWNLLKDHYGKDLKSVFVVVTTLNGGALKQNSLLIYPPDGKAEKKGK